MKLNAGILISFLLLVAGCTSKAQSDFTISNSKGVKVIVTNKNFPLLKVLLPGQSEADRGIEIEFPEHVTGLNTRSNQIEHLYFVSFGNANKRTLPVWHVNGNSISYKTKMDDAVTMIAAVSLEEDGLRYTYKFINHSTQSYLNLQAVTCVKLYSLFSDTLLQRTYVHHTEGFDLLASETPERLTMPLQKWLPCRYLVSYTWPVNPNYIQKGEDSIIHYNKSRKVDKPFIATISHDGQWIAATYTKETGNLWTNPERTCQHADPYVDLNAGETKSFELRTFIIKDDLDKLLQLVNREMNKN